MHGTARRPLETGSAAGLRRLNVVVGCAHAVQAIALLMLAADASCPSPPLSSPDHRAPATTAARVSEACASTGSSPLFFCLRRSTT
jgi:hypothetical protein